MMFYITHKVFIRSLFAVNILLLCSFSGFSQFRVKGKITDEKGESLIGVNVMLKNTSTGTLSGLDGSYSIEVSDIIEIDSNQFKQWKKNDIDNTLYTAIELDWKLTGPRTDIVKDNTIVYGVSDTNQRIVELKSVTFTNLRNYLTDYLEYSIYSPFVPIEIKNNFVSS